MTKHSGLNEERDSTILESERSMISSPISKNQATTFTEILDFPLESQKWNGVYIVCKTIMFISIFFCMVSLCTILIIIMIWGSENHAKVIRNSMMNCIKVVFGQN